MQYVVVAPNIKTALDRQFFDYEIPLELLPQIKIRQLIQVPFHGRDILGVIVDLKKKTRVKKLKQIKKILSSEAIILPWQLKLAKWISEEYFCPLGKVIFSFLPNFPKKTILASAPPKWRCSPTGYKARGISSFAVVNQFDYRLRVYQKIIEKAFIKKKQVLILFSEIPDFKTLNYFQQFKFAFYHAGLKNRDRIKIFNEILNQKHQLVIGSQAALFSPLNKLSAIIIDTPVAETFKSERAPYLSTRKVAEKIGQIIGAKIILGEEILSTESFHRLQKNKLKIIGDLKQKTIETAIINLAGQKSPISFQLEEAIRKSKKTIIFCDRKGEGRKPSVILPYPQCKGLNRKLLGWTTQSVEKVLKKIFPNRKICCLDKEQLINLYQVNWEILVSSVKLFDFPFLKADLIAVQSLDRTLNLPYFEIEEKVYTILKKLKNRANKKFIIQTFEPERRIYHELNAPQKFLSRELMNRRENQFPPFYRLIKLTLRALHLQSVNNEVVNVFQKLKKTFPEFPIYQLEQMIVIKIPQNFSLRPFYPLFSLFDKNWKIEVDAKKI